MKALVLAGGTGSRLRPISHTLPKQLVPVANRPLLHYILQTIRDAGVREVGMVVRRHGDGIRPAIGDGSAFGLEITYIPQEHPLGLAHCVQMARGFLADDDFLMFLGDNLALDGVGAMVEEFRRAPCDAQVAVIKSTAEQTGTAALDDDGRVLSVTEKPVHQSGDDLVLMGIYLFTPAIHRAVREISPSARGELEITDAIGRLIETGMDVRGHRYRGFWRDAGVMRTVLECNQAVLDRMPPEVRGKVSDDSEVIGRVIVAEGASVSRSRLVGPLIVGAGTAIDDSYVGAYTSVGEDCRIDGAGLEYSIVMDRAEISGVRAIRESVIGRGTRVRRGGTATVPAHRLTLGDDSTVAVR